MDVLLSKVNILGNQLFLLTCPLDLTSQDPRGNLRVDVVSFPWAIGAR